MIYQLNEADKGLFDGLKPCHYSRRIKSHYLAYGLKYDFARFFTVTRDDENIGLISIFNASMMITEFEGKTFADSDIEEIALFIQMNKPYSVELDMRYADKLNSLIGELYGTDLRTEFAYSGYGEDSPRKMPVLQVDELPSVDDVFDVLKESFPTLAQSYELWIADTSHRIRHGLSQSFLVGDYTTATIQYLVDKTALVGHVATKTAYRGQYHARRLLYWIGGRLTNDGFDVRLFARPHRVSYYEEIGFKAVGHDLVFELKELKGNR